MLMTVGITVKGDKIVVNRVAPTHPSKTDPPNPSPTPGGRDVLVVVITTI